MTCLSVLNVKAQKFISESKISLGMGMGFDYNNALFPKYDENSSRPEYLATNWKEDPLVLGRVISFSWSFLMNEKLPVQLKFYKGDYRQDYSDDLMFFAGQEFDKLYAGLVLGSYLDLLKNSGRHRLRFDYGLHLYRLFTSIVDYEIDIDEDGNYIPGFPLVNNNVNRELGLNIGFEYGFYSKNEKSMIGLKIDGFGSFNSDFFGWIIQPTFSYSF
ncbi:hypothetical protein SAMN05661096_04064 [Marivirga sericea]|uniref:Uncharacterized protein n=1 Tax=Marivirga sericea TaxID=1028 RepID=A0A1X7LJ57_9BACT|nr:hypothetical protein SAMN05661096_04064 [Marivirga sericea]